METRASYLVVGSFVLAMLIGLVGFTIWIAQVQFDATFRQYDILFDGSVSGLKVDSPVAYRGITVGKVTDIRIDPANLESIPVTIEVRADTPIREDTVAKLELQGITGGSFVNLQGGSQDAAPLQAEEGQDRPVIASEASGIAKLFEGAPRAIDSANELLLRAMEIFSDENIASVGRIVADVEQVTEAVAARSEDIALLIHDAGQVMANLRDASIAMERLGTSAGDTMASIDELVGTADGAIASTTDKLHALIDEFQDTAQSFSGVGREVEALVAENREPIRDFASTGLYELIKVLTEVRGLVASLNRLTTEFGRDPGLFVFGDQQQGYEFGDR